MKITNISIKTAVFRGLQAPETGTLVGYGALIEAFNLAIPLPETLSLISEKRRSYRENEWIVYSNKTQFEDTLYKHLVFALKNEGINLLFFKKLFEILKENKVVELLSIEGTGQYTRKLWFLYEWLLEKELPIPNLEIKNYVLLVDEKLQYTLTLGARSSRHRIINNLPGTVDFCPLIRKTPKLKKYRSENLSAQ